MATRKEHTFPRRNLYAGSGLALTGYSLVEAGVTTGGAPILAVGAAWACGAIGLHAKRRGWIGGGQAAAMTRWDRASDRHGGLASRLDVHRTSSRRAMRKRVASLAPGLADAPRQLRRDVRRYSVELCRVGAQRVRSSVEEVTTLIGGPRMGKSEALAGYIIQAPGAVVSTSTRTDLIDVTRGKRAQLGPVHIFNPGNMGGIASTVKFDVLAGCRNFTTSRQRAEDLVGFGEPGSDAERWMLQGRQILSVLLHAAAVGDRTIRDVLGWVANPRERMDQVRQILADVPDAAAKRLFVEQFAGLHEGGMKSVMLAVVPALGWIMDDHAMRVAEPGPGFDVEEFVRLKGTLYILGSKDSAGIVAPLVAALTAHIAREARRIADASPGGRLDPALSFVLDEAYLICPVPLPVWTSDMGGRNIAIFLAAQEIVQLEDRWGKTGAEIILGNTATLLVFGGMKHVPASLVELCDTRRVGTITRDGDGKVSSTGAERVPVFSAARISALRRNQVIVMRSGMRPALGKAPYTSGRRDVRRAARAVEPYPMTTNYEEDARNDA